ncbi:FHA domain-containing protein At4g14490-like [Curcuma longa]|uniref:FHA domain-containing protein At4g14490-like n=1 Tax=Curcuma longa TaxID=136217 RepID=UPI003D9E8951
MELPYLRLTVEKGPKQGETFECKALAVARVGRIVKGNHLAVRDPGVSQKHLTFQFQHEASSWSVSDLGTSNGTLVNGFQIPPSSPFPVSDGDTIKIGEFTVISVKVLASEGRQVGDFCDEEEERREVGRKRRRGARNGVPSLPVVEELVAGVTNGNKDRKGRGRPKKGASASASVNKDEDLQPLVVEQIVEVEVPLAKPRTRGRRPATRSTSIASKDEKEVVKSHDSAMRPDSKDVEAVEAVEAEKKVVVEGDITEKTTNSGEREELAKEEEEEEVVDLDKMTLGQWFARMEKVLPLMINDMAEEAIANLRETASRFDEFIEMSSTSQLVQIC